MLNIEENIFCCQFWYLSAFSTKEIIFFWFRVYDIKVNLFKIAHDEKQSISWCWNRKFIVWNKIEIYHNLCEIINWLEDEKIYMTGM